MWHVMDIISHCVIPCDDQARAQKFYETMFGWQIAKLPGIDYYWITATETDPETMMPKTPGSIDAGMRQRRHPEERPVITMTVESLDESLEKVSAAGGKVVLPNKPVGNYGFYAEVSDTEGNVIGMWQSAHKH